MRDFAEFKERVASDGRCYEAWDTYKYDEDFTYVENTLREGLPLALITCKDFGVIPLGLSLWKNGDKLTVAVEFDEPPAGSLYWEGRSDSPSRAR